METAKAPRSAMPKSLPWITGLLLGIAALTGHASDFYTLKVIAESTGSFGTDWRILGGHVGINDAGVVTWGADRSVNGAREIGVFASDGVSQTTIATGNVATPSINNLGQVMYVDNGTSPGRMRLWSQGSASDFYVCNQQPNPLRCYSGGLSDNTRVPLQLLNGALGIVGAGGQIFESGALTDVNLAYTSPIISRNGRNAAIAGRSSANAVVVAAIDQTRPGQVGQFTLGPTSDWNIIGLSQNDHGNIALLSGATTNITGRLVGVVTTRSATPSLIRVADTSDGTFSDFGSSPPTMGVAINNLNEVAFYGKGGTNSANNGVYVGDVSGRTPLPVVTFNETFSTDGARFQLVFQNGFSPQAINGKGQIVFFALIQRGTQNYNAILRADPIAGVSPSNPIMPEQGTPLTSGWRFRIPFLISRPAVNTSRRYIDPPIAVGYEYKVEAPGPNFASVYVPAPLTNGDDTFQVEFNGQAATLKAGEVFDFTTVIPGGVSSFRVTGIDTAEALDPTNAQAFVTGLTFLTAPTFDFNVTMTPIVVDPDDTDLDGVPNAADVCPNTAPGATVDASGCSTDQRDSDRDGVVDSRDQCPATPLGSTVDANGCSAAQLDADGDGVANTADLCPGTAPGAIVDASGCSADQRDGDGDGVADSRDQCPGTPLGSAVDANGCSAAQLDADGDGVPNTTDACPNTAAGAPVDSRGCSAAQRDTDGDGVNDSIDRCPNTPAGAAVNSVGCAASQLDSDGDGVTDDLDACPGTAPGTTVDSRGCPLPPPPTRTCDVNADNFVDYRDIALILIALGQPARGTSDPRDANRNGKIDLNDAALCTKKCDRNYCLPAK